MQLRAVKRRDANDAPTCTYVRPSAMTRNWSNILPSPSRNRPLEGEFFELSYKISISARNVFISTNIYHRIFNIELRLKKWCKAISLLPSSLHYATSLQALKSLSITCKRWSIVSCVHDSLLGHSSKRRERLSMKCVATNHSSF